MATLAERAEKIRGYNKELCKRQGSGFHDGDKRQDGKPNSPQSRGLPANRDHVVAFQGKWEHTFTGECAIRVQAELSTVSTDDFESSDQASIKAAAAEYAVKPLVGGCLTIRNGQWNDVVNALAVCGVGITVAGEMEPKEGEGEVPTLLKD